MNKNDIRQANRKALPKFLIVLITCLIVGIVVGYSATFYRPDAIAESMKNAGLFFETHAAPWLLLAIAVIMPVVCTPIYRSAKKLLAVCDDEDEVTPDIIDRKMSTIIWFASIAFVLSLFLFSVDYPFDGRHGIVLALIRIAAFFAIAFEWTIIQQKCVDTIKQLNPEKKTSVYDLGFQKKWLEESDEAEKNMIGKCALKAYSTTNIFCMILYLALSVAALVFDIGFLPSLMVCLVLIVNISTYYKEALRYSIAGNTLS